MHPNPLITRRQAFKLAAGGTAVLALAACGTAAATDTTTSSTAAGTASSTAATGTAADTASSAVAGSSSAATASGTGLFDSSTVHTIGMQYADADYQAMIAAFTSNGDKNWVTATVTIDGTSFSNVGVKLKGNSTLRSLSGTGGGGGLGGNLSADKPEGLPWRIRLDKYVDGQNFQGQADLVIRGGTTETSLNEAVALELIGDAGLATELAASTRFSVNGGTTELRLVIQNPTDEWDAANFNTAGILYKAEAEGSYAYVDDNSASYTSSFSVEASTSGEDDYTPLIAFLKFINSSDDATFAADLSKHLDVTAFTTYLAAQDLVENSDDIAGPGNNSYLRVDTATSVFTVVAWDQNLSLGGMGGGMGGGGMGAGGGMGGGQRPANAGNAAGGNAAAGNPAGGNAAAGNAAGGNAAGGMGGRGGNILASRFKANSDFNAAYTAELATLKANLYASGTAQKILDTWTGVLKAQASDLVPTATVDTEAAAISKYFST